ncbi:hypothetical protein GINT2_000805 [Glugoides intestinalis]
MLLSDENGHTEVQKENQTKAEKETTEEKREAGVTPKVPPEHPKASTLTCLEALLGDIVSSKEDWPEEVLRKVLVRFGRMPRTGWSRAHSVYCGKFEVRTPLVEFKKKASRALTAKSGRKCTAREFKQ